MLPAYGVLIGNFTGYTKEQGQWLHVDMNILAVGESYQAAVDVNEPTGQFQYLILNNLDTSLFTIISSQADGWHLLDSNSTSGAMDYARSPIFQKPLGCLGLFWGFIGWIFQSNIPPWNIVTGDEAGVALVNMVTASTKVYVFGAPYPDLSRGPGVHQVHCNQGDAASDGDQPLDGIWQDGCVFAIKSDGTLSAYLGKFATQTLQTNNSGLPLP